MTVSAYCEALLQRAAGFHPLYGDRMASHLPMALIALDRMGAKTDKLDTFFHSYAGRLSFLRDHVPDAAFDPQAHFGQEARYPDYLAWFRQAIATQGKEAVLREWVPRLTPGLAASAFHGMIRLAYAVEANVDSEFPQALAYWASCYEPLGDVGELSDETAVQIADRLAPLGASHKFAPGIIVDRIREVGALPEFRQALRQPRRLNMDTVRDFCLDAYQENNHITLLHVLTGTHAFRTLLPYQSDADLALRYHWQAVLAALLSTGLVLQGTPNRASIALPNWGAWLVRTTSSVDSHRIKLIYTCWQEFMAGSDLRYAEIAGLAQRG